MANYNKQFNFRNGLQVDNDNLIVSPTGLVGIGTTIPTELLDVRGGNAKISGFATAASLYSNFLQVNGRGIVNNVEFTTATGAGVTIGNGIITATNPLTGIVTYYGDARFLSGMPTSQWTDVDAGLGYTSIYAAGSVGVGTTDPRFTFQVSGNTDMSLNGFSGGVGINSAGEILATGIVTASKFSGIGSDLTGLTASNIAYGTISNERLPILANDRFPTNLELSGILTATTFSGRLVGVATGAEDLVGTPNLTVGILTASAISSGSFIGAITGNVIGNLTGTASTAASLSNDADVDIAGATIGIATVSTNLTANGTVGIGTSVTTHPLQVRNFGNATISVLSDTAEARIAIGRSDDIDGINGVLRYENQSGLFPYSNYEAFDFLNYGNGNINYYLQAGNVGLGTGNFHWHKGVERLMTLTYGGDLGIGITEPNAKLQVAGVTSTTNLHVNQDATVGGNLVVDGNIRAVGGATSISADSVYINGGSQQLFDLEGNQLLGGAAQNVNVTAGMSTYHDLDIRNNLTVVGNSSFNPDHDAGGGVKIGDITVGQMFAPLQIGDGDTEEIVIIEEGAIGIGTTAINPTVALDCRDGDATFRRVGLGTTAVTANGVLQLHGPVYIQNSTDPTAPGAPTFHSVGGADMAGIVTATGGFSSGAGGGVQITVVGSTLTFTVNGVGSTSLTLS